MLPISADECAHAIVTAVTSTRLPPRPPLLHPSHPGCQLAPHLQHSAPLCLIRGSCLHLLQFRSGAALQLQAHERPPRHGRVRLPAAAPRSVQHRLVGRGRGACTGCCRHVAATCRCTADAAQVVCQLVGSGLQAVQLGGVPLQRRLMPAHLQRRVMGGALIQAGCALDNKSPLPLRSMLCSAGAAS